MHKHRRSSPRRNRHHSRRLVMKKIRQKDRLSLLGDRPREMWDPPMRRRYKIPVGME